jgi:hypothetical protein
MFSSTWETFPKQFPANKHIKRYYKIHEAKQLIIIWLTKEVSKNLKNKFLFVLLIFILSLSFVSQILFITNLTDF